MKKTNKNRRYYFWKYWLDLNVHIKQALAFAGLILAVLGSIKDLPWQWSKNIAVIIIVLLMVLMIFQFILGVMKVSQDTEKYEKRMKS